MPATVPVKHLVDISFLWQVAWRKSALLVHLTGCQRHTILQKPSSVLPKDDVCAWKLKKSLSSKLEK